jgi:hypothetical protein
MCDLTALYEPSNMNQPVIRVLDAQAVSDNRWRFSIAFMADHEEVVLHHLLLTTSRATGKSYLRFPAKSTPQGWEPDYELSESWVYAIRNECLRHVAQSVRLGSK